MSKLLVGDLPPSSAVTILSLWSIKTVNENSCIPRIINTMKKTIMRIVKVQMSLNELVIKWIIRLKDFKLRPSFMIRKSRKTLKVVSTFLLKSTYANHITMSTIDNITTNVSNRLNRSKLYYLMPWAPIFISISIMNKNVSTMLIISCALLSSSEMGYLSIARTIVFNRIINTIIIWNPGRSVILKQMK